MAPIPGVSVHIDDYGLARPSILAMRIASERGSTPQTNGGGGGGPTATRPAWNTGVGFFVSGGKLYDANGNEFRMRGVNKVHWDNWSVGLLNANANACRWNIDFTRDADMNVRLLRGSTDQIAGTIGADTVVIPASWDGTCQDDTSYLTAIVDTWVTQFDKWQRLEPWMILNIANEWGPGGAGGTTWRDAYIEAIGRLRTAGYRCTISITAGGCGQDPGSIVDYGQAVFASDPQKNVIFDQHIYGVYQDVADGVTHADTTDISSHFAALAATGLYVHIGEFGPGRNIGPSPTLVRPERVIQLAEQNGLGWLAWAWDDNDLDAGASSDDWFSMSFSGDYTSSADLTTFGKVIVENPTYGLKTLAETCSIFPAPADDYDYGDGGDTVGDGTLPLDLSTHQPPSLITAASVPEAMRTGQWQITITPNKASSAYKDGGIYEPIIAVGDRTIFIAPSDDAGAATLGVEGGAISGALVWSPGAALTLVVDVPGDTITVSGAGSGNGSFGLGGAFNAGPLSVGTWANGGSLFDGAISNVTRHSN